MFFSFGSYNVFLCLIKFLFHFQVLGRMKGMMHPVDTLKPNLKVWDIFLKSSLWFLVVMHDFDTLDFHSTLLFPLPSCCISTIVLSDSSNTSYFSSGPTIKAPLQSLVQFSLGPTNVMLLSCFNHRQCRF